MSAFSFRRLTAALMTGISVAATGSLLSVALPSRPALAQTVDDFRVALESYGFWQQHPRWGEVWVPFNKPRSWRPYTVGRWIYTDEWGWYWSSEQDEEAWGWIAFHYGRWIFDRRLGWAWVPGEEWAPAWVNWRRGDSIVGWAPAPPEDVVYDYDDDPDYWTFVEPRYLVAPRLLPIYFVPFQRTRLVLRQTVVVNRTFVAGGGRRFAVNPGINPAFVAARVGRPINTFSVRPRVLAGTAGVAGAIAIQAAQNRIPGGGRPGAGPGGRRGPAAAPALPPVQIRTASSIQPAQSVPAPQPLGRERGRLGNNPPRAAQGAPPPAGVAPASPSVTPNAAPNAAPTVAPSAAPGAGPNIIVPGATPGSPPPPNQSAPPPGSGPTPTIVPQPSGDRSRPFGPAIRQINPQGGPPSAPPPPAAAPPSSPPAAAPAAPAPVGAPPAGAPPAAAPTPAPPPAPASPPPAAAPPPASPPPAPPPAQSRPERRPPPPPPPPNVQRPTPPAVQRPAPPPPPAERVAPPPQRPAPPPQARPAPPPQAQPAPPPQARPAPPPQRPAAAPPPPPKPAAPPPPKKKPDEKQ